MKKKQRELPVEFTEFISVFSQVYEETCKAKKDKISGIWLDHFNKVWLPLVSALIKPHKNEGYHYWILNSILFIRLFSMSKQFYWLQFCAWSGAYHQLIRELRFALESCIQAYYIDREHPDTELNCKFEILEEIKSQRLIGAKLIDATDLEHKNEIKNVYSFLSRYVHSTSVGMNKVKDIMLQRDSSNELKEIISFTFNNDLLNKSIELTNKTMDIIYYMCLNLFPGARLKLKQKGNVINSLKELNCTISKSYIEKIGE